MDEKNGGVDSLGNEMTIGANNDDVTEETTTEKESGYDGHDSGMLLCLPSVLFRIRSVLILIFWLYLAPEGAGRNSTDVTDVRMTGSSDNRAGNNSSYNGTSLNDNGFDDNAEGVKDTILNEQRNASSIERRAEIIWLAGHRKLPAKNLPPLSRQSMRKGSLARRNTLFLMQ
jgi:hypothetical protein